MRFSTGLQTHKETIESSGTTLLCVDKNTAEVIAPIEIKGLKGSVLEIVNNEQVKKLVDELGLSNNCVLFGTLGIFECKYLEDRNGTFYKVLAENTSAYYAISDDNMRMLIIGKSRVGKDKQYMQINI